MPDYDCYGFCVLCHKKLLESTLIKGTLVEYFTAEKCEMEFKLNDGSKMRVTICASCKDSYNSEQHDPLIMDSVKRGWDQECNQLVLDESKPNFTQEWKEKHMEVYYKKEIVKES